jgi:hypothetical protein
MIKQVDLQRTPLFVQQIAIEAAQSSVPNAVQQAFICANIQVRIIGATDSLYGLEHGVLLAGDHRQTIEPIPLLAVLGEARRNDFGVIAHPFSLQSRLLGAIASSEYNSLLPVVPRIMTKEHRESDNGFKGACISKYWRLRVGDSLPTTEEASLINQKTLVSASQRLANGGAVLVMPTGSSIDSLNQRWRPGLGNIINGLIDGSYENTQIVPFRFDDFSRARIAYSLIAASHGLKPRRTELMLRLGTQCTPRQLLGEKTIFNPQDISDKLHRRFINDFRRNE